MSADYTTVGLIKNTKRRGFIPTGSGLTTSELLQVLSEQLRVYIPAFLKGLREEFIVAELAIAVTAAEVPVPVRACGNALRTIGWREADGGVRFLTRIEPERRGDHALTGSAPIGFMFRGNNCILIPAVTSGTLVVSYQQRPGQLVLPTSCAVLASSAGADAWNATGIPTSIAAGVLCDIVSAVPNFKLLAMDVEVASVGGGIITFTEDLPTDLAAGDYVCLASETPIPQIPLEAHELLAQVAAYQIACDTGSARLDSIKLALDGKEGKGGVRADVAMLLAPRADGSARVIVNRSGLGRRRW